MLSQPSDRSHCTCPPPTHSPWPGARKRTQDQPGSESAPCRPQAAERACGLHSPGESAPVPSRWATASQNRDLCETSSSLPVEINSQDQPGSQGCLRFFLHISPGTSGCPSAAHLKGTPAFFPASVHLALSQGPNLTSCNTILPRLLSGFSYTTLMKIIRQTCR